MSDRTTSLTKVSRYFDGVAAIVWLFTTAAAKMAGSRGWDPRKVFDISEAEKKAMQERAQMRATLRKEWQMKSTSPFRGVGGFIVSKCIQTKHADLCLTLPCLKLLPALFCLSLSRLYFHVVSTRTWAVRIAWQSNVCEDAHACVSFV